MKLVPLCLALFVLQSTVAVSAERILVNSGGSGKSSPKILSVSLSPFAHGYRAVSKVSMQLGGPKRAGSFLPDASFVLRDVYVFPNPAKTGKMPTIHVEVGVADQVQLHIYDIAGDLVHSVVLSDAPQIIDDGTGKDYAYEYKWEDNIASGVYLCVVRAQKSGYGDINKTIKLAVIR